jgi:hypothetical protein
MNDANRHVYPPGMLQIQVDALIETFVDCMAHEVEEPEAPDRNKIRAALYDMVGKYYAQKAMLLCDEVREPQMEPFC